MDGGTTFHFVNGGIEDGTRPGPRGGRRRLGQHRRRRRRRCASTWLPDSSTSSGCTSSPILLGAGERLFDGSGRRDVRADRRAPPPAGEPPDLQGRAHGVSDPEITDVPDPRRRHPAGPVPQVRRRRRLRAPRRARSSPTERCWSTARSRRGAAASSSAVPSSRSRRPAGRGEVPRDLTRQGDEPLALADASHDSRDRRGRHVRLHGRHQAVQRPGHRWRSATRWTCRPGSGASSASWSGSAPPASSSAWRTGRSGCSPRSLSRPCSSGPWSPGCRPPGVTAIPRRPGWPATSATFALAVVTAVVFAANL